MSEEMSKVYDPKALETEISQLWANSQAFHAQCDAGKPTFTMVIPPPNVTAALHLGHALNNTLQDILIRWHRMVGDNTLWMPGTDHAGIATQTVVEKRILAEEGKKRTDFQRDEFVGRVQEWKDQYEARILHQLQQMGCSCDWNRVRFTMDDVCAKAVRATFFKLFQDGLIYRGKRLVNWDPATQTVLADDEVEHELVDGHFWYMQYPLTEPIECDGQTISSVTVATTRPETMLGDTAVAMNPRDPRAAVLVGKTIRLPLVGREIPIVADEHVVLADPESDDEKAKFSTGFLKVTPAHDPNDWEIGRRHDLPIINVMAPDGSISDKYGWEDAQGTDAEAFLGMDRFAAREAIVEWFRKEKLLEKVRDYAHEVGHSYRSHVPIEPYLSDQWYIAVKKPIDYLADKFGSDIIDGTDVPANSLAGLALKPLRDGRLRVVPQRYEKNYAGWLENLRDWPISRQLWWGHQIPVWTIQISMAQHTDPKEKRQDSQDRLHKEFKQRLNYFLEKCGFSTDQYYYYRSDDLVDGKTPYYLCSKNPEIDKCLSLASKVKSYGEREEDDDVRRKHNREFRTEYGEEALGLARHLGVTELTRDPDVLDTWFSSALWPFSTLGWPEKTPEVQTYYPGNVLTTAREIITLWVSRMVMMGQYCVGDIPFSDVFIHAMIQDGQGRKMSKSLGNGIDPLIAIDSHGADAMRFTLASMTTQTQDVRMPVESMTLPDGRKVNTSAKFDIGRNFCNKLWNASRFAMGNFEDIASTDTNADDLTLEDRWILSRLHRTIAEVTQQLREFKFSEPINALYRFFWNELCDWYLEFIKPRMRDDARKASAQQVLGIVLDQALRMLHPFMPFITEGIYQQLNKMYPQRHLPGKPSLPTNPILVKAAWPQEDPAFISDDIETQMQTIQEVIRLVRDVRSRYSVAPREPLTVTVKSTAAQCAFLTEQAQLLQDMAFIAEFSAAENHEKPRNAAVAVSGELEIYVHGVIDPEAERARLTKQKETLVKGVTSAQKKLANENFVNRAQPEVVQRERERLAQLEDQLNTVQKNLDDLD